MKTDKSIDKTLADTFPASDASPNMGGTKTFEERKQREWREEESNNKESGQAHRSQPATARNHRREENA